MEICSRSGQIKLLNKDMRLISTRSYFTRGDRERIIKKWKLIYGEAQMLKMAIQIVPDINKEKDDKTISKIKRMAEGAYGRHSNKKKYQEQITKAICQQLKLKEFRLLTCEQYSTKNFL